MGASLLALAKSIYYLSTQRFYLLFLLLELSKREKSNLFKWHEHWGQSKGKGHYLAVENQMSHLHQKCKAMMCLRSKGMDIISWYA